MDEPSCGEHAVPAQVSLDAEPTGLFRKERIDVEIVDASIVLSAIAEAGGKACLPVDVTDRDFRLWAVAVQLQSCNPTPLEFPFSALCTVAKVCLLSSPAAGFGVNTRHPSRCQLTHQLIHVPSEDILDRCKPSTTSWR